MLYDWLRALHIISFVAWMAGLFYLPRLFVYHALVPVKSEASETFKVMERKLFTIIMMPAMTSTFIFGAWLLWENPTLLFQLHMGLKLGLVFVLFCFQYFLGKRVEDFARDKNLYSSRAYRFMNEVPTLLLIGIVFLVILKPWT